MSFLYYDEVVNHDNFASVISTRPFTMKINIPIYLTRTPF
ncbi:hypothetical protein SAMN04488122_4139 [Chitinophaga arvensicola]|uniref:Uncharacterized protein n=1 Tax=Chitinophaga arvensicola TaxID=29529 RepID=A0A1I0S6P6_9BACT|nr:hypothetical protein SAMN04488122_4139 [Chitinophaga arvensicola]